jgi:hypothetical protein
MIILCPEIHRPDNIRPQRISPYMPVKLLFFTGAVMLVMLLFSFKAYTQSTLEVGAFGGASYYIGDINPAMHFKQLVPAYGFVARYSQGTRFAFRFNLSTTEVTADDAVVKFNEGRGLNFKSRINDASFVAEFNFFDYFTGSKNDYVTPFIFGGVSIFHFTPRDLDDNLLRPLGTEGQFMFDVNDNRIGPEPYSQWGVSVPFGLGIKYSLTKRIGVTVEWRMHKTFTDYIDDISTVYPGSPDMGLHPTGDNTFGVQRGDRSNNDWYSFTGASLTYRFNLIKRHKCLELDGVQNW